MNCRQHRRPALANAPGGQSTRATKLAFFLQDLVGGGAERVMLTLAGGFADRGYDVDFVLVRAKGHRLADVPPNVRVVTLGTRRTAYSILRLARYLRRERPQALLSALVHVNIAAILAARLSGADPRVIITEHNQVTENAARARSLVIRLAHRAIGWLYPLADEIVAVSAGVAESLMEYSGLEKHRVSVIHNPVVTPALHDKALAAVTHRWFAPDQPPVILGAGRLTAQKDFTNLLHAFAIVRRSRPARLVILGEGPERAALCDLIARLDVSADVDMPGFDANPYGYMSRASLFVLSSAWEGLPTVLIEAMACGTPVVATDCRSGPDEILVGGRFGELVPVADPAALAAAILRTLERPPPAQALRARAGDFSIERAVDHYAGLALGAGVVAVQRPAVPASPARATARQPAHPDQR
jgi:glycosyltransferase involved in cell wall biosynthesis